MTLASRLKQASLAVLVFAAAFPAKARADDPICNPHWCNSCEVDPNFVGDCKAFYAFENCATWGCTYSGRCTIAEPGDGQTCTCNACTS
jgi:hypothetical protein